VPLDQRWPIVAVKVAVLFPNFEPDDPCIGVAQDHGGATHAMRFAVALSFPVFHDNNAGAPADMRQNLAVRLFPDCNYYRSI
jgi:hypothetical protein